MNVTVFSAHNCVQCNATYRALDKYGIEYKVIIAEETEGAREFAAKLGQTKAPLVLVHEGDWRDFERTDDNTDQFWYGYRPDRIKEIPEMIEQLVAA